MQRCDDGFDSIPLRSNHVKIDEHHARLEGIEPKKHHRKLNPPCHKFKSIRCTSTMHLLQYRGVYVCLITLFTRPVLQQALSLRAPNVCIQSIPMLRSKYFNRFGFSAEEAETLLTPSKVNLDKIMEAHLERIPFENLSQHGLSMPATLDMKKTATKVLEMGRGGFCCELNGLFADFLTDLGYQVKRVPAFVHADGIGFRYPATHLLLVVSIPNDHAGEWIVDVSFGEPAINSLRYELDTEQSTPEGMESRLVVDSADSNFVILEWKKDGQWLPRLKWEYAHPGQPIEAFQPGLDATLAETSIFHQKLIVCRITRTEKLTLAGSRLKRTLPRFGPDSTVTVIDLETPEAVTKALKEEFGISNSEGLELFKSSQSKPEVWSQL